MILGAAGALLAFAQVRRVERAVAPDVGAIAMGLLRMPIRERPAELLKRTAPGSFAHTLAIEIVGSAGEAGIVTAVNEALDTLEWELTEWKKWPAAAARIVAWATVLDASVAFIEHPRADVALVAILAIGGASTVACISAMRRAEASAAERRKAADRLVTALLGRPAPENAAAARPPGARAPGRLQKKLRAPRA